MEAAVGEVILRVKEDFVPELQSQFGDDLKALILYGSAAGGPFIKGVSDVNLLVLSGSAHPDGIVALGKNASTVIKKLRLSLHFLTLDEFFNSSDVFPMEYLDIVQHHELILGEDPVAQLSLHRDNLRHQVEERLRGSVNALRQALLASRGKSKLITELLSDWFGSQTALFRGALRLIEAPEIPTDSRALVQAVAESFGLNPDGIHSLIDLRENGKDKDPVVAAVETLGFLTALVRKIDSMDSFGKKEES